MRQKVPRIRLNCQRCGNLFFRTQARINSGAGKYCSKKCIYPERIIRNCAFCGKEFSIQPSRTIYTPAKFCSTTCSDQYRSAVYVGPNNKQWKGNTVSTAGYIHIYQPYHPRANKRHCVPEHILVAEKALNRFVLRSEEIHHINGIKFDNRPENLYLFPSHSEHQTYHCFMRHKNPKVQPITESNLKPV